MAEILTDKSGIRDEEKARFVLSFVEESDRMREDFSEIIRENLQNYMVQPFAESDYGSRTDFPFATSGSRRHQGFSLLKDSQSHEALEVLLSKVWNSLFGVPGFIKSKRRGIEDAFKASAVTRLLDYVLGLEGHTMAFYLWLKDGLWAGTGILELYWDYVENQSKERVIDTMLSMDGDIIETSAEIDVIKAVYDDARINHVDILKFYPDPGQSQVCKMLGAAKEFTMTARRARENGTFNQEAVRRALATASDYQAKKATDLEEEFEFLDRPQHRKHHPDFMPLKGFEYWGEVPWKPKDGNRWRVLTLYGEEIVRDRPWPLLDQRLPFYEWKITPMAERFYGLSPLEVSRFDQDLADVLKMMIADAVVKSVHPPHIIDRNADVDLAKIRRFHPNVPILTNKIDGVQQVPYAPPIGPAAAVLAQTKQSIQERTGALGVIAGQGLGVDRASATEAQQTFNQALDRPEMVGLLIEREYLPPIGKGILGLYQQFLESTEDLRHRIGSEPPDVFLADLLDDYDFEFVGSRLQHNKASKLAAMERTAAVVGATPVQAFFPWEEFFKRWLRESDLNELEALVGVPEVVQKQMLLAQVNRGGASNGNMESPRQAPSGLLPAQTAGGEQDLG